MSAHEQIGAGRARSVAPDRAALPPVLPPDRLRTEQAAAAAVLASGASVVVHGAPGAGRTVLALAAAAQEATTRGGSLLLVPRRALAARLQDALALAGAAEVRVMTPPGLAFAVLRARARLAGAGEPSLVTGAEQDALLAELIAAREDWELEVDPGARSLPGFRDELRDLITRAGQLGLDPASLERLGRARRRPAWIDAAAILRDYLGVLDLEAGGALDAGPRLDSGALVRRAAAAVDAEPEALDLPTAVIVDDAQDLTVAGADLVAALGRTGRRLLATSCPDTAVDAFRGGRADAAALLARALPAAPRDVVLTGPRSAGAALVRTVDALRGRLPLAGAPSAARRPDPAEAGAAPAAASERGILALRAADEIEEARLIASALREAHHRLGVPYDDMAVLCRSGAVVEQLADQLTRAGLPVRTPRRIGPLSAESVVADLLDVVDIAMALGPGPIGADEADAVLDGRRAAGLLAGPYGDVDALRLRRIRRELLDADRAHRATQTSVAASEDERAPAQPLAPTDGETIDSDRLLARALVMSEAALAEAGLDTVLSRERARTAAPLQRLRAMISAARAAGADGAAQTLWAAWDGAGLATGWQRAALEVRTDADAARSRLLVRRLDAVMALFAAAERFTERRPGADAADLVEHIRSQTVAEDTLAPVSAARGRVDVLTPAQLAGEHRDTVVLARLQEGSWPNLRLRSTLFGAAELSLLADAAMPEAADHESLRALQRDAVIVDELRLAVAALSRARERVLVTAVDGGDQAPSALFAVIEESASRERPWLDGEALRADPGPAPDPRRLVAALRSRLRSPDPGVADRAAHLLAALERAGASGIDPRDWHHQEPSTTAPLLEPGAALVLSPSALERAAECPRAWLLERSGGQPASGAPQLIGTALHALAEQHPRGSATGDVEDLLAQLHRMLRPMGLERTWSGRRRLERAEDAVRVLDDHLRAAPAPLAVEAPFEVELGSVRLRGKIDRIEGDDRGLQVSDLKTGRTAKSKAAAEEDLQLAAYQAAVREGALDDILGPDAAQRLDGARLVHVGTGARSAAVRTQGALARAEHPAWFDDLVVRVAEELAGRTIPARRCAHCDTCAVRSSCPLQPEGAQL